MHTSTLSCILVLGSVLLAGCPPSPSTTYSDLSLTILSATARSQSDGGYLVTGTGTDNELDWHFVLRLSDTGDVVWKEKHQGSRDYMAAASAPDGGLYVRSPNADQTLLRLSGNGDTLWSVDYRQLAGYSVRNCTLAATPEGGCAIAGMAEAYPYHLVVMKLNPDGGAVWVQHLLDEDPDTIPREIVATGDGGFAVAARKEVMDGPARLVRLDAQGALIWRKQYESIPVWDRIHVSASPDGGLVLAGTVYHTMLNANVARVVSIDTDGNVVWTRDHGLDAGIYGLRSKEYTLDGLAVDGKGRIVISGEATTAVFVVLPPFIHSESVGYVMCFDKFGATLWHRDFGKGTNLGGLTLTSDGQYVVAGGEDRKLLIAQGKIGN